MIISRLIILLLFIFLTSPADAGRIQKKFVYYIHWAGIRAGKAVLTIEQDENYTIIKTHATSASLISLFYKVDDTAMSIISNDAYPVKFILKVRQGRHKRDKVTLFERIDNNRQRIIFHNIRDNETFEYYSDVPAYDPLSAFYEMTRWDLRVGESVFINIFDNKKLWKTEVQVLRKERIRVPAGEFDTIVVKPILKSEGIFLKTGDIYIWTTDDDVKLPVKLKSKAIIGSFTAVLVEGDL